MTRADVVAVAYLTTTKLTPTDIYLQSPIEMQGAISFLLESELFEYHYERMVGVMMGDAQEVSYFSLIGAAS